MALEHPDADKGLEDSGLPPLYVDLDGTLVATDTLLEAILLLAGQSPLRLLLLPVWMLGGKARFKEQVCRHVTPDARSLPYRPEVLEVIRREKDRGRRIVLCTASHRRVADQVADHVGLFDAVLATEHGENLAGARKRDAIREHVGGGEYAYMGNAAADIPIWRDASECWVVAAPKGVRARANELCRSTEHLVPERGTLRDIVKAIRPHQWSKNVLVAVPLFAAHQLTDGQMLLRTIMAIVCFSMATSAVYLINDLLDLPSDRRHPKKLRRPLASGRMSIPTALLLAASLFTAGLSAAAWLCGSLLAILALYVAVTTAYSLYLKRKLLFDVIALGSLYTMRLLAGGAVTGIELSFWLLTFSMFFFISLAFMKRYSELARVTSAENEKLAGRDYRPTDLGLLQAMGIATSLISVLVVALYLDSPAVRLLYGRPEILWLACLVLFYWLSRLWFCVVRDEMPDDPVVFALTDRNSYLCGLALAAIVLLAR
jgi:4-hydroxybenzoate polyprenyltransferase